MLSLTPPSMGIQPQDNQENLCNMWCTDALDLRLESEMRQWECRSLFVEFLGVSNVELCGLKQMQISDVLE